MTDKSAPLGIKVIAGLYFLAAVLAVFTGIGIAISPGGSETVDYLFASGLSMQSMGMVQVVLGILVFFIGNGLREGARWAQIAAIVVCVLAAIEALDALKLNESMMWKVQFGVAAAICIYLAFSKAAREHFA